MVDVSQVETGLGVASIAGAAIIEGADKITDAVTEVAKMQTEHATALTVANAAVSALANAAEPAVAALPAADAEKALAGLGLLKTVLAELRVIFAI